MSAVEPLRVSFVGLGQWAGVLGRAAARSERLRMVSCHSRSRESTLRFADRFGCEPAESFDDVLADRRVEAVVIAAPNDAHADLATRAAAAGKHLWIEKPLANTVAAAQRIAAAAREAGVRLMVGHAARMLAGSRELRRLIEAGELGQVQLIEADFSTARALALTPGEWRYFAGGSPGGPLSQLAVHHFDLVRYLAGPITRVSAFARRLRTPAEVPDVAVCNCETASGALACVGSSWASPGAFSCFVYGTRKNAFLRVENRFWSDGEEADRHSALSVQAGGADPETIPLGVRDMYRSELEELAVAVRAGRAPEVDGEAGVAAVAALEAALRSVEEGRAVAVDEVLGHNTSGGE